MLLSSVQYVALMGGGLPYNLSLFTVQYVVLIVGKPTPGAGFREMDKFMISYDSS